MVQKVLLLSQIFEMDTLMDLCVLKPLNPKITLFSGWSVCVYACLLSDSGNSKHISVQIKTQNNPTQKQITTEASNLVLFICINVEAT